MGNGDGTFQPQVSYAVGVEPYSAAVADFNGDGIPDLAVSNSICFYKSACGPGTVSILLGNGDGTFQPDVEYVVGLTPTGLAAGDLNGQGGADVAVANVYSNSVSVLFNLPVISVFPNTVAFAREAVGKKSPPRTVTIGNPSGTPIGFTSIKVAGADPGDFAESNTCPIAGYAGARRDLLDCGHVYADGFGEARRQDRTDGYRAGESAVHHADGQRHITPGGRPSAVKQRQNRELRPTI
jgi:hypothetical protein